MKTTDQIVLITGGTRGIGLALAERFLKAGNRVIVTGRHVESVNTIRATSPDLQAVVADMTRLEDLQHLHETFPDVTILINNAGVQYNYPLTEANPQFDRIAAEIQTNFLGLVQLTALYLPTLQTKTDSAIVNFTSGLAYVPKQSAPIYCATKSAVHTFTVSLRWQLESTLTKVFEVIPPLVETTMTVGRNDQIKITPEELVEEFWSGFRSDRYQMAIGRAKTLLTLNRVFPSIAQRIMRHN